MATYTTVQDGNWDDINTWGGLGYPTDGDTATIVHVVTYNISDDVNTISLININTNGILQWLGGLGVLILKFTNMVISGGKLVGRDGTFLRCLGYIQVTNTNYSEIDMKGSIPNKQTILSENIIPGDHYITVLSSDGFGVGDYISIYDYSGLTYSSQTNENFIINYISNNNIYLRKFVGVSFYLIQDTLIGSNIFYTSSDVRYWRSGMTFIIDDELFIVKTIDIVNKIIYTNNNSTKNFLSGKYAYETGAEYFHNIEEVVYKLCTTIVNASSNVNYIDVNSSGGWSINDEIAICGASYSNIENRKITNISIGGGINNSDRLILDSNLMYNHSVDGIVVKINRDCVFHGRNTDSVSTASGYIYILANSANRTFNFENFEMRYYGNSASSYYYGLVVRNTYNRTVKILNTVGRHTSKSTGLGSIIGYSYYYNAFINNVIYDTQNGIGQYSSGGLSSHYSGNIAIKINSYAFWNQSSSSYTAWDYNIAEGCNSYVMYSTQPSYTYFTVLYNGKPATRNWYLITNYCNSINLDYNRWNIGLENQKWLIKNVISKINYRDVYSIGTSIIRKVLVEGGTPFNSTMASDAHRTITYNLLNQITLYEDYNFIPGNKLLTYIYGYGEMDESIKKNYKYSWKFTPKSNTYDRSIGFFAIITAQKGRTIKVGGYLRKDNITNSTVKIDMYDDYNNLLIQSLLISSNIWEWKTVSYSVPNDMIIIVKIGGYGSTGNFWISEPTIYTDGCLIDNGILSNFWIISDPTSTGIRLSNGIKII